MLTAHLSDEVVATEPIVIVIEGKGAPLRVDSGPEFKLVIDMPSALYCSWASPTSPILANENAPPSSEENARSRSNCYGPHTERMCGRPVKKTRGHRAGAATAGGGVALE